MAAASFGWPPGANTTSRAPITTETKKAHWCETPRRRGLENSGGGATSLMAPRLRGLAQLVGGGEEAAHAEGRGDQSGESHGAEQDPQDHQLEAHRVERLGPAQEHPHHDPGEGDQAS